MDVKKLCSSCGAELTFNRSIGFYECSHCGTIHKPGVDNKPLSIDTVDEFMQTHKYDDALHVLVKLIDKEPDNPYFFLRSILLKYRMTQLNILLNSSKNNKKTMESILHDEQWDKLKEMLPEDKKDLTKYVISFCVNAIEILDNKAKIKERSKFIAPCGNPGRDETMDTAAIDSSGQFYSIYGRDYEDESEMIPKIDHSGPVIDFFQRKKKSEEADPHKEAIEEWSNEIRDLEIEQTELLAKVKELEALI